MFQRTVEPLRNRAVMKMGLRSRRGLSLVATPRSGYTVAPTVSGAAAKGGPAFRAPLSAVAAISRPSSDDRIRRTNANSASRHTFLAYRSGPRAGALSLGGVDDTCTPELFD